MSTYRNGKIPSSLLVRRGDFLLTAGTWAKFDDFSSRIKRRTGVTLTIPNGSFPGGRGEGAYRDYDMQVRVKNYWISKGQGRMAAAPGYSSHGGEFNGQDALAIDIDNWARVPLSIFFEEGRAAGFQMGYFDGKGGRPYEPWHIIDRDPYRVSPAGGNSRPVPEEDDMPLNADDKAWLREMTRQEIKATADTVGGMDPRLKLVEGAVARFPGNGVVQPRTDDLAVWLGIIMDMIRDIPGAGNVDEDALAAALAPKLIPHLPAHLSALSDEDVRRIATEGADEIDRRERERLG